jgi:hypothetical protein
MGPRYNAAATERTAHVEVRVSGINKHTAFPNDIAWVKLSCHTCRFINHVQKNN